MNIKLTEASKIRIKNFEFDINLYERYFKKTYDKDAITISDSASSIFEQDDLMIQLLYVRALDRTYVVINKITRISEALFDVDYGDTIFSDWMQGYDAASIIRIAEQSREERLQSATEVY